MQNIEMYTINYINRYWNVYKKYLEDNKDKDIDFPEFKINFK